MVLGSLLLGTGMALAGSGPTLTPAQLGCGVTYAGVVLAGMVLGGVAFGTLEHFGALRTDLCAPLQGKQIALDKILNVHYATLAVPMGFLMIGVAIVLEVFLTAERDAQYIHMGRVAPLPPVVCGLIIGLNQIPIRAISGKGQGGSSSVLNIIGTMTFGRLLNRFKVDRLERSYQFLFVYIGTTLGSLTAFKVIPGFTRMEGYEWYYCLVGGFLTIFGSRIANGCTCGNGISGTSELSWHSFIGAGSIFAGAIATGFILQAAGADMML